MNGIILILLMAFFFGCTEGRVMNYTVILKQPVKECGDRLVQLLSDLCDRKFHSEHNDVTTGSNTLTKSKRALRGTGVVDQCCNAPCDIEYLSKYCQEIPSNRKLVDLHVQIVRDKSKKKEASSALLDNEVRKVGNSKDRQERASRKAKTKKPVYVNCMYRSFAHYLLKHSRRLQRHRRGRLGDVYIKKEATQVPDQQQEGTATQHKLGGGTGVPKYSIS